MRKRLIHAQTPSRAYDVSTCETRLHPVRAVMSSSTPLVSIIIPTFNMRRWVGEAVDSALAQSHVRCEVIVVDYGSTDGTGEWLAAQYGSRIRYLLKEHGLVASGRNFGLRHARGKYIQFLDADDLLLPRKVATHAEYLESHPDVGVVYSDCLRFRDDQVSETYELGRRHLFSSGQVFETMLANAYLLIHMPLLARSWLERVDPFDEELTDAEDFDFWLRLAWAGANFQFLDGEPLVLYRVRSDSVSQRHAEHGSEILRVIQKVRGYVADPAEQHRLRLGRVEGGARFVYGRALAEDGRLRQGVWHMARGLAADRRDPVYKAAYMALAMVAGPRRAGSLVGRLKETKDLVLRRGVGFQGNG